MLTKTPKMENPDRIGFRLEKSDRDEFEKICQLENISMSELLQLMVRKYVIEWKFKNQYQNNE